MVSTSCKKEWLVLFFLSQDGDWDGLDEKHPCQSWTFEHLVPGGWCCLGRFGMCSLPGGNTSLGQAFQLKASPCLKFMFSAFCFGFKVWSLRFLCLLWCLPFVAMPLCHYGLLLLWKHKPQLPSVSHFGHLISHRSNRKETTRRIKPKLSHAKQTLYHWAPHQPNTIHV